jgi:hypothetical protein
VSTPTRLANKTIWSIEDALAGCARMRRSVRTALDRAESKTMDPVLILALAHLSEHLNEVERILRDARNGKYEADTHHQTDRAA